MQGGRDDERYQDKPGDSNAPRYVDCFGVQREDLRLWVPKTYATRRYS